MFSTSGNFSLSDRTVGVVERDDIKVFPGYNLLAAGREQYLIDMDGRVVHEWTSKRGTFCAYLLPNGNLIRDGSEVMFATGFETGGAAGFVEEVTWDNQPVWSFSKLPYLSYLTHHDLEPMPNGNVLIMFWQKKSKEEAIAAGRCPKLIPDGEVWDQVIEELKPNSKGGAKVIWTWSLWDHLVQDFDESKENFGDVKAHHELFDINFCPPGGKAGSRNRLLLKSKEKITSSQNCKPLTGERDWIHANSVSYDPVRDQIIVSLNVPSEVLIIDHSTTIKEAAGHSGGRYGKGGDILWRYGNSQTYRHDTRMEQKLFMQHSATFLRGVPGEGHVLIYNNGRNPDRRWSSMDELRLPETSLRSGIYIKEDGKSFGPSELVWSYGPKAGRRNSFYCTHASGVQRLPNGNTLITHGPYGIVVEVTPSGDEVWRYISPVLIFPDNIAVAYVRQGDQRTGGRKSLFCVLRYAKDYPAFDGKIDLMPGRYLEA